MDRFYSTEEELLYQGKKILGKALVDLYGNHSVIKANESQGKGAFGNIVEELHYGISNNNRALPDVQNLSIEIKTNPLEQRQDGTFKPKEVVSLGMIDFSTLVNEDFDTSTFIKKNLNILYNMYWYESKAQEIYNYKIALVDLIKLSDKDLKVIRSDWEYVKRMASIGRAEELSKGDTNYLAAGTKGQGNQKKRPYHTNQGEFYAKRRAFVFKTAYIRSLLDDYTLRWVDDIHPIFEKRRKPLRISILKDEESDIQEAVKNRFNPFIGMSDFEIAKIFDAQLMFIQAKDKSRWHWNTSLILTGKKKKNLSKSIDEFSKSGLTVKTIRVDENMLPLEEVSFRTQDYGVKADSNWKDSSLYEEMSRKFLWVVYQRTGDTFRLKKVQFWSMPDKHLSLVKGKWKRYKEMILSKDFRPSYFMNEDSFYYMKIKDNKGGKNKRYAGLNVTSLSHWFRKKYVQEIIS